MIRREVEAGATLVARWTDEGGSDGETRAAERRVDVAVLPFPL